VQVDELGPGGRNGADLQVRGEADPKISVRSDEAAQMAAARRQDVGAASGMAVHAASRWVDATDGARLRARRGAAGRTWGAELGKFCGERFDRLSAEKRCTRRSGGTWPDFATDAIFVLFCFSSGQRFRGLQFEDGL